MLIIPASIVVLMLVVDMTVLWFGLFLISHTLLCCYWKLWTRKVRVRNILKGGYGIESKETWVLTFVKCIGLFQVFRFVQTCWFLYIESKELTSGQENMCSESHMQFCEAWKCQEVNVVCKFSLLTWYFLLNSALFSNSSTSMQPSSAV